MREQRVVDTAQRTEEPMADGQLAVPLNLILGVHELFAESGLGGLVVVLEAH